MSPTLTLETTAYTESQLAHRDVSQVALAGRSNVGKSSLINTIAGRRKALAKVSATPGKTRSINYYRVAPGDYFIV
ncbi:MAG: GTPase, partial [Oceanidesulfovibrio sp.]